MLMPDGTRYEGGWKAGASRARACSTQANGDRYEGAFVAGRREGLGRAVSADGDGLRGRLRRRQAQRRRRC